MLNCLFNLIYLFILDFIDQEMANSLDKHIRQNLLTFVDNVEKLLLEQMRLELHADDASDK